MNSSAFTMNDKFIYLVHKVLPEGADRVAYAYFDEEKAKMERDKRKSEDKYAFFYVQKVNIMD